MARKRGKAVVGKVQAILGAEIATTPTWLRRPGKQECKRMWPVVSEIFRSLTSTDLPDTAPPRDQVRRRRNHPHREAQLHSRVRRSAALHLFQADCVVALPGQRAAGIRSPRLGAPLRREDEA